MWLQVNYHGAYVLTRLLESTLIASAPSRVVNVSSVEHRIGLISDVKKFMFDAKKCLYPDTKLANALFAYELQRRLGHLGVQVGHSHTLSAHKCVSCSLLPKSVTDTSHLSRGLLRYFSVCAANWCFVPVPLLSRLHCLALHTCPSCTP